MNYNYLCKLLYTFQLPNSHLSNTFYAEFSLRPIFYLLFYNFFWWNMNKMKFEEKKAITKKAVCIQLWRRLKHFKWLNELDVYFLFLSFWNIRCRWVSVKKVSFENSFTFYMQLTSCKTSENHVKDYRNYWRTGRTRMRTHFNDDYELSSIGFTFLFGNV